MTNTRITLAQHVKETHNSKPREGQVITGDVVGGDVVKGEEAVEATENTKESAEAPAESDS